MRWIILALRRAPRYGLLLPLVVMVVLQLDGQDAFAQTRDYALPGNQDYYAPRISQDEIRTLANVELYHLGPGLDQMAKGRYFQALQEFEFILRYYPNHPKVLSLLADLCRKWKERSCPAENWFQKAIERNPNVVQPFLLYGIHLHREGRVKEAVKAYQRVIELDPNSINGHYNLGLAYMALEQYDLANQEAQKSYQLGAALPGLRNGLEKRGKWNPAVRPSAGDLKPASQPLPEAEKTSNEADTVTK